MQNRYTLSRDELDEFIHLAGEAAAVPKGELAKTAMTLTTHSFLELCALVYEVTSPKDISSVPIEELYCQNKMIGMSEARFLEADTDSPTDFAAWYNKPTITRSCGSAARSFISMRKAHVTR